MTGIFRASDLKIIESVLYKPKDYELSWSTLFGTSQENHLGEEYGYDYISREGQAKITSKSPTNDDIKFGSESLTRVTYRAFHISNGFSYTDEELAQNNYVNSLGGTNVRPPINLEFEKAENGRRLLNEQSSVGVFKGVSNLGIFGLFNHPSITPVVVTQGVAGATAIEKKKFINKTGDEIWTDILNGFNSASQSGRYQPDTFACSHATFIVLQKRYSLYDSRPVWEVISKLFPRMMVVHEFRPSFSLIDPTYDSNAGTNIFCIFENSPQIATVPLMIDLEVRQERFNLTQENKFLMLRKQGGLLARRPQAIYIGRDI
jgi:hypothetical protein